MQVFEVISVAVDNRIQRRDNLRLCSLNMVAMLGRTLTRQAMKYNVTSMCVREIIVEVEKQ
jgi:hypothetical protein